MNKSDINKYIYYLSPSPLPPRAFPNPLTEILFLYFRIRHVSYRNYNNVITNAQFRYHEGTSFHALILSARCTPYLARSNDLQIQGIDTDKRGALSSLDTDQ